MISSERLILASKFVERVLSAYELLLSRVAFPNIKVHIIISSIELVKLLTVFASESLNCIKTDSATNRPAEGRALDLIQTQVLWSNFFTL